MNIAYQGGFLREGLVRLGHTVVDIPANKDIPLHIRIQNLSIPIDFVLLELYGNAIPVEGIRECDHELVAYCIDSPLNGFWAREACALFDHVFVDQRSTVDAFAQHGITSCWLPLCCQEAYFVDPEEKIYDIAFIGTINEQRLKRYHLLKHIQKYFTVNTFQHVPMNKAQKIFAQSKIVLNENFFSGLTLRVFQGLAANTLVFTEKDAVGVDSYFIDGEHLVEFTPYDILEKLHSLLTAPERRERIAHSGRLLCEREHTSESRARTLLSAMRDKTAYNPRKDEACRHWHELRARYLYAMRFGGVLNTVMKEFETVSRDNGPYSSEALLKLGDIYARSGHIQRAEHCYLASSEVRNTYAAWVKLALLYVHMDDSAKAKKAIDNALQATPHASLLDKDAPHVNWRDEISRIFFLAAQIYFAHGDRFDMGFVKYFTDIVPDTALDVAFMLWRRTPCPQAMEMLLRCVAPYHLEGELLPDLLSGIRNGCLSNSQILRTAEIAARYYDLDTADTILSAFKSLHKGSKSMERTS